MARAVSRLPPLVAICADIAAIQAGAPSTLAPAA
jgi:hypothetical protein